MSQQLRLVILALAYFTRLPMPQQHNVTADEWAKAARYLPLAGWLVGGWAALVLYVGLQYLPVGPAIVLSMLSSILLTGALHEDGLADTADGLGGGWSKEQALTIMKDSRIGSYGAIALVIALLLKFNLLSAMQPEYLPLVLIAAHAVSRLAALMVMSSQRYAREEGKAQALASPPSIAGLLTGLVFGLLPMLLLPVQAWLALLPVLLVWVWFSLKLKRRLGGYTGDCLGAMQQLTELAFYLGIVIISI